MSKTETGKIRTSAGASGTQKERPASAGMSRHLDPLINQDLGDYFRVARQNEAARAADATREVTGAVVAC
jgi:hypothetical protein